MATVGTESTSAHLRRALELAEGGRGRVSPNPMVGAVLVRDDGVIGEGFHAELGNLHAERAAIEDCRARGEDPAGSTLFVTLEPCAHSGRQPPCTEAILEAGISRVVYASDDPTDKAAGRGPGMLRDGGVDVELANGPEAAAARLLNQPFRKRARTGRPLVTYKAAMTLDGRVASPRGDSRWISNAESRELVHRWRDGVRRRRRRDRDGSRRRSTAYRPRLEGDAPPADARRLRLRGPAAPRFRAGRLDRRGAADRGLRPRGGVRTPRRPRAGRGRGDRRSGPRSHRSAGRRAGRARTARDPGSARRGRTDARRARFSTPARSTRSACSSPRS